MKSNGKRASRWLANKYSSVVRQSRLFNFLTSRGRSPVPPKAWKQKARESRKRNQWWKPVNLSGDTQLLRKSVRLETLEPRILLTADTWELNLADLESYDDTFVLRSNLESGNLEVLEAGELLASMLYSEIDAINITGTDNADTDTDAE